MEAEAEAEKRSPHRSGGGRQRRRRRKKPPARIVAPNYRPWQWMAAIGVAALGILLSIYLLDRQAPVLTP